MGNSSGGNHHDLHEIEDVWARLLKFYQKQKSLKRPFFKCRFGIRQ
ncbi:hypothetical protein ACFP3I_05335 [Chryseobacterium arachidis]